MRAASSSLGAQYCVLLLLMVLVLPTTPASNQYAEISSPADIRSWPYHEITPSLRFGAWAYVDFDYKGDYDLARRSDDNRLSVDPETGFSLAYTPDPHFQLYLGLEAIRFTFIDPPAGRESSPLRVKVSKLDMVLGDVIEGFSIQVGRQRFEDEREWFVDETMDGVRVHFRRNRFASELSISQELLFDEDLLNSQTRTNINNYLLVARYAPNEETEAGLYWLTRDDTSARKQDLHFLGLQAFGGWNSSTTFWMNAAYAMGESDRGKISGWGIDIGASYLLEPVSKLSLSAGFAFGSGDDDPLDNVDHGFRQTGNHDNNAKFNGVTSFRYYGELFRPSVSNIMITTLGGGFRPTPHSSIDLVYHYYRQHHADTELSSALLVDPTGSNTDLGHELDLVVGISEIEHWKFELVLGVLLPGQAFEGEDSAYFGSFEFSYDY